ncbi:MAG TPA: D-glycerate dehydrogenase [Trueperaceae bacterium]|nr:D-glycerate dehydrogenase [Trueperaceae bacterium]
MSSEHRVYITRRLSEVGLAPLRAAGLAVVMRPGSTPVPRAELLEAVAGASALVSLMSDRVDAELLDAAGPRLRVVANYAVGYDNVDVAECLRRGVVVTNTPDVLTHATADHAFALLLAVARRLRDGDELVRSGGWAGWEPTQLLGRQVSGAVLGVVGMGRIGAAVAARGRAFGMQVLYHNRRPAPDTERATGARYVSLETLLATSDFVSLHCPLTPETHHLLDAAALARMKRTAVLVNTARGAIVDEAALVVALSTGVLWGAGLDVYEHEPQVTPGLSALSNVVLAPHTGSATSSVREGMARLCAEAVVTVLGGGTPPSTVTV